MKYMTKFLLFVAMLILPLIGMAGAGITFEIGNTTSHTFKIYHEGGVRCWHFADFGKYQSVGANKISLYSEMINSGSCNLMVNDIWYMRFVVHNEITGVKYPFAILYDLKKNVLTIQGTKNEVLLSINKGGFFVSDGTMTIFLLITGDSRSPQFQFFHTSG